MREFRNSVSQVGVGVVGVAAAAKSGVELAAIHAGRDDDVGLVDGEALRSGDSGSVGKSDVLGDVVGGEGDPGAVAEVFRPRGSRGAGRRRRDVPAIVVVDPLVGTVGKAAVVASGFDVITDADGLVLDVGVDADPVRLDFASDNGAARAWVASWCAVVWSWASMIVSCPLW